MTTRSFPTWATPRRHTSAGPDQHVTIRRGDTPETITIRQAGHEDWDTISDHWNDIADIANTEPDLPTIITSNIGPPRGGTRSMLDTADADTARNTHINRQNAIAWLREHDQLTAQLARLAQRAHIINTPPAAATKKPVLERCVKCRQEIDPTADDGKTHRVGDHPLHANTCYHQVWRQSVKEQIDMQTIANHLAAGIHA